MRHIAPVPSLVDRLPPGLCDRLLALPVRRDARTGTVDVAVVDARDPHPAEEIGHWLKAPVRVVRTSIASMESALLRLGSPADGEPDPGMRSLAPPIWSPPAAASLPPPPPAGADRVAAPADADVRIARVRSDGRRARLRWHGVTRDRPGARGRSGHPPDPPEPRARGGRRARHRGDRAACDRARASAPRHRPDSGSETAQAEPATPGRRRRGGPGGGLEEWERDEGVPEVPESPSAPTERGPFPAAAAIALPSSPPEPPAPNILDQMRTARDRDRILDLLVDGAARVRLWRRGFRGPARLARRLDGLEPRSPTSADLRALRLLNSMRDRLPSSPRA